MDLQVEYDNRARVPENPAIIAGWQRDAAAFRAAWPEAELGIDPDDLTDPWQAAGASMAAFTVGALLPLLTITLVAAGARVPVTAVAVALALAVTGLLSATSGGASRRRAVVRNVVGGLLAMAVTYVVGGLVGGL